MSWLDALLKGLIQGLTEFLPVSSTAHLILYDALGRFFEWNPQPLPPYQEEFFAILLHLGTLVSVGIYFRHDLKQLVQACWLQCRGQAMAFHKQQGSVGPQWDYPQLAKMLVLSFAVTGTLALGVVKGSSYVFDALGWSTLEVRDISEFYLRNPNFVIGHLAVTGLLLWLTEAKISQTQQQAQVKNTEASSPASTSSLLQVQPKQALLIGLFQAGAAIFHGISRSGSTIAAGVFSGLSREVAARYSFLLSFPIFTAASMYEAVKLSGETHSYSSLPWLPMLAGMGVAALVGYFCIAGFIQFVGRHSLRGFALYCWAVSLTLCLLFNV